MGKFGDIKSAFNQQKKSEVNMLTRNVRRTRTLATCDKCKKSYQATINGLGGFRFNGQLSKSKINKSFFDNKEINICKKCKKAR